MGGCVLLSFVHECSESVVGGYRTHQAIVRLFDVWRFTILHVPVSSDLLCFSDRWGGEK